MFKNSNKKHLESVIGNINSNITIGWGESFKADSPSF